LGLFKALVVEHPGMIQLVEIARGNAILALVSTYAFLQRVEVQNNVLQFHHMPPVSNLLYALTGTRQADNL